MYQYLERRLLKMKTDIMSLDVKVGYEDILKNEKILKNLTIGQLKGVHHNLHKKYNLKDIKKEIKFSIYKAHNMLIKIFEEFEIRHCQIDALDIHNQRKIIEKKKQIVNKRQVFLLRKSVKKVG